MSPFATYGRTPLKSVDESAVDHEDNDMSDHSQTTLVLKNKPRSQYRTTLGDLALIARFWADAGPSVVGCHF